MKFKFTKERQMQAKTIRERRNALGLSQQALAERARCSFSRVGQIEREAEPQGAVHDALIHALTIAEQQAAAEPGSRNWSGDSELPQVA